MSGFWKHIHWNRGEPSTHAIGPSKNAEPGNKPFKYFILLTGKTLNSHNALMDRLERQVPDLQVVQTEAECDIILVFCPVVRGPEHDIKAALEKLNGISDTKPAVLVVLHHTFDPAHVVSDNSRAVSRGNTIMVNFLFHEDQGLLQCRKNEESLTRIVTHIKPQIQSLQSQSCVPTGSQSLQQEPVKRKRSLQTEKDTLKYFILLTGRTLNTHKTFIGQLKHEIPQLQQVSTVDECDVILAFCTIASRAGTDIEAATKKLNQESAVKPAVLVVLHRTFDPEQVVPNSSRSLNRENTITVDCLFHEDHGLMQCRKNQESFSRIMNYIKHQIQPVQFKEENVETLDTPVLAVPAKKPCKYFVLKNGYTPDSYKAFMGRLVMSDLQEVKSEDQCDFILTLCRGVSQDGIDFQRELKTPESISEHDHELKQSSKNDNITPDVENFEPMETQEEGGASQCGDKLENMTSETTLEIQLQEKDKQLELAEKNEELKKKEILLHLSERHPMIEHVQDKEKDRHLREITREEKKLKEIKAELDDTIKNLEQKKKELQIVSKHLSEGMKVCEIKSELDSMQNYLQEKNKQIQEIIHPESFQI